MAVNSKKHGEVGIMFKMIRTIFGKTAHYGMMEHSYKLILDSGMHTLGELRIIRTAKFNYMAGEKVKIEQLGWVIKHDNPYLLM